MTKSDQRDRARRWARPDRLSSVLKTVSATSERQLVELRQYALVPGRREALIDLFDREFVETQEGVGIEVIGQFRISTTQIASSGSGGSGSST